MAEHLPDEQKVYTRGQKLWWKGSGYGYKKRIPVVVCQVSASGKRVLVRFETMLFGKPDGAMSRYVALHMLEPRHE